MKKINILSLLSRFIAMFLLVLIAGNVFFFSTKAAEAHSRNYRNLRTKIFKPAATSTPVTTTVSSDIVKIASISTTPTPVTVVPAPTPITTPTPVTIVPVPTTTTPVTVVPLPTSTTPAPAPVTTTTPNPATVSQYGIAAGGGLTGKSQADLDKYFASLLDLGAKWVRWDISWSEVQPSNSTTFNWTATDRVAATAKKYGINSLGIITYTPEWARLDACKSEWKCAPASSQAFGTFAAQVASRYKDSISNWEIWNEPNITVFWGPAPDVARYTGILKSAYAEIKKVNPNAFVLSAGLSPAPDSGGDIAPLTFLNGMYANGAKASFDAVALHPYTFPALPSYVANWNAWQQLLPARQIMVNNGDSAKKIWITEFGAPTNGPGKIFEANQLSNFVTGDYVSEAAQASMVTDAINFYKQNTSWLGAMFSYSLKDNGTTKESTENFYGLTRYDGSKKPAYAVLQNAISSAQ